MVENQSYLNHTIFCSMSSCNFWPTTVELMLHKIASVENQIFAQLFIQNQESTSPAKGKYFSAQNINFQSKKNHCRFLPILRLHLNRNKTWKHKCTWPIRHQNGSIFVIGVFSPCWGYIWTKPWKMSKFSWHFAMYFGIHHLRVCF